MKPANIRTAAARTLATLGDAIRDRPFADETTPLNDLGEFLVSIGYCIDEQGAASA